MKKNSALFNAQLIYFIALICFVAIRILVLVVDFGVSSVVLETVSTVVVQVLLMFLLPVLLFSKLQKQKIKKTFSDFNYHKMHISSILVCVLIGFLCYFLNLSIASFFGSLIRMFGYESAPSFGSTVTSDLPTILSFVLEVVTVAVLPAICEETMHRGLLLKGYSCLGIKHAVILSSLLFGLMHLNINQFFYATVLGFIIACSVIISKNIIPAIIIHFMNNFLSVYFSYATANNWVGKGIYNFVTNFISSGSLISFFITNCFLLFVLIGGIVALFTVLLKQTRIRKVQNMLQDIARINKEYQTTNTFAQDENMANLYNLNNLMAQYNIKSVQSMVFTELENKSRKPNAFEIVLIVGCFVLGALITSFTFIWGIL